MMDTQLVVSQADYPVELASMAWLDAHTTSEKTLRAYNDTFVSFRQALQRASLDITSPVRDTALALQAWAGHDAPSENTYNQRIAIVSSFYTFARKRQLLAVDNPAALLDRRKVQAYAHAEALSPEKVTASLQAIDRSTLAGKRDFALLAVAFHTGRRVSELAGLRRGDMAIEGDKVRLVFRHAKGGKVMRDTLPVAVGKALLEYTRQVDSNGPLAVQAVPLADMPLWVSLSRAVTGTPLTTRALSSIAEKHLGTSKVHTTRHTFARAMEDAGAKVSVIQARLGHSSLATTGRYLAALRSEENTHGEALATLFGVGG